MNIEKLLQAVLTSKKEERVGKVDMSLVEEFKNNQKAAIELEKKVKDEISKFIEKITAENEPEMEKLEQARLLLWEKMYDELNLSESERGDEYTIKTKTGVICRIVKTPLFEGEDSNSNVEESVEKPLN